MIENGAQRTREGLQNMEKYALAITQSTPKQDRSKLQQHLINLLDVCVILDDEPSVKTEDLLPYLNTPDTEPIKTLLAEFLSTVSASSAQEPLEFLLSLDWDQVFKAFVTSYYTTELGHIWSRCDISIQNVSSLLHAKTREELLTAEKATSKILSKINLQPAASFTAVTITAQV